MAAVEGSMLAADGVVPGAEVAGLLVVVAEELVLAVTVLPS